MASDPSLPTRVVLVAPAVSEQQTEWDEQEVSWLQLMPTTIARCPVHFHIFTIDELSPTLRLPHLPCGDHPPPAAAFLSCIIRQYDWLPDRIATLSSYERGQMQADGAVADKLQVLARLKWELLDSKLDFVPLSMHPTVQRCEERADMSDSRLRSLSHVLSMMQWTRSSRAASSKYPRPPGQRVAAVLGGE